MHKQSLKTINQQLSPGAVSVSCPVLALTAKLLLPAILRTFCDGTAALILWHPGTANLCEEEHPCCGSPLDAVNGALAGEASKVVAMAPTLAELAMSAPFRRL